MKDTSKIINERIELSEFMKDSKNLLESIEKKIDNEQSSCIPIGKYAVNSSGGELSNYITDEDSLYFNIYTKNLLYISKIKIGGIRSNDHKLNMEIIEEEKIDKKEYDKLLISGIKSLVEWAKKTMYTEAIEGFVRNKNENYIFKEAGFKMNDEYSKIQTCIHEPNTLRSKPEELILTAGPAISQYEICYAKDAAKNGWNREWSKYLDKFEDDFAKYIGVKHALATSSCTGALQIALMALKIREGDEVIVPDQTWVATANAIRYVGATPIFVDVNMEDWTMSIDSLIKNITSRTKAIIPVHMYGHSADMTSICNIAREKGIFIIEDAAPSLGAEHNKKKTGSFGDFSAFSFQGAKMLVTGEGGMLLTNNTELYERARKIWDQGRNTKAKRSFWIDEHGVKFKMANIQAAIGLGQLKHIETMIEQKRRINKWYSELLEETRGLRVIKEKESNKSIYWMTCIQIEGDCYLGRDALIEKLREDNVDTRPVFPAISQYPIWGKKHELLQENANIIGENGINLPSGVCLNFQEVEYVCNMIRKHLNQ